MSTARCHPDRQVFSRELCQGCYRKVRLEERPIEAARKAAGLKRCSRCGQEKTATEFTPNHGTCKPCRSAIVGQYTRSRKDDPAFLDARRRASREWARRNRAYGRNANLRRKYGITSEEYDRLVKGQKGRCLVCRHKPKKLVVDHDHTTGHIRGLLCDPCNQGIGFLREDPKLLERAIAYLSK